MTSANARYFLTKPGTLPEKPELGREMTSEAEALVEAFKTGQPFFTLVAWKAASEIDNGASQNREGGPQAKLNAHMAS
jgi:hypothetical protein